MAPISIDIGPQVWRRAAYARTSVEVVLSNVSAKPSRVLYREAFPKEREAELLGI